MKLVSWNVNGIRAAMDKGFRKFVEGEQPEVICLQETKATPEQVDLGWAEGLGYAMVWNCAVKKGYSGTTIWSKHPFTNQSLGIGIEKHDHEGRVITVEYADFYLVNVYTPNAQRGLARLDYRKDWDMAFLDYVTNLCQAKPVIFCGDLNCAHHEIDLANPKANKKNAGFSPDERAALDSIAEAGFVDSFREFDQSADQYSWWTYRMNARERNIGWRLDYFWVAESIMSQVVEANVRSDVFGSDHCPVEITLKTP